VELDLVDEGSYTASIPVDSNQMYPGKEKERPTDPNRVGEQLHILDKLAALHRTPRNVVTSFYNEVEPVELAFPPFGLHRLIKPRFSALELLKFYSINSTPAQCSGCIQSIMCESDTNPSTARLSTFQPTSPTGFRQTINQGLGTPYKSAVWELTYIV